MKKTIKFVICSLLAFAVMLSAVFFVGATGAAVISVEQVIADKDVSDGTVSVALSITNNPGIAGLSFELVYDSGITLTKVEKGDALPSLDMSTSKILKSPLNIGFDSVDVDTSNGVFAVLTFEIPDDVSVYEISINPDSVEIYDFDLNDVDYIVENGFISVDTANPDVDNDKKVTQNDIYITIEEVAGKDTSGNKVENADFDGDKKITVQDLNSFMKLIRRLLTIFEIM